MAFYAVFLCRSDPEFLCRVLAEVIKAGATTLNIPDTVGYTIPKEFGELIAYLIKNTEGADNVIFSTHCQNDLGLATGNTLAVSSRVLCSQSPCCKNLLNLSSTLYQQTIADFMHSMSHLQLGKERFSLASDEKAAEFCGGKRGHECSIRLFIWLWTWSKPGDNL